MVNEHQKKILDYIHCHIKFRQHLPLVFFSEEDLEYAYYFFLDAHDIEIKKPTPILDVAIDRSHFPYTADDVPTDSNFCLDKDQTKGNIPIYLSYEEYDVLVKDGKISCRYIVPVSKEMIERIGS